MHVYGHIHQQFAQYLGKYNQKRGHGTSMTRLVDYNVMNDQESFYHIWENLTGESWDSFRSCEVLTDVLIGEAQILYGTAKYFWQRIKDLTTSPNNNIRVLLLSMYSVACSKRLELPYRKDYLTGGDIRPYICYIYQFLSHWDTYFAIASLLA